MGKGKGVPTVRQVLKSNAELKYWNNYVAIKIGVINACTSISKILDEVGRFNDLYQDDWLDKPVNEYCDAMARYVLLLGLDNL